MPITATCSDCGDTINLKYCVNCLSYMEQHIDNYSQLTPQDLANRIILENVDSRDEILPEISKCIEDVLNYYFHSRDTCSFKELLMILPVELEYESQVYDKQCKPSLPIKFPRFIAMFTRCYILHRKTDNSVIYRKNMKQL